MHQDYFCPKQGQSFKPPNLPPPPSGTPIPKHGSSIPPLNLAPRVLWLFGQWVGTRRDSGEFEKNIGCLLVACIVLPQKSCGNNSSTPESLLVPTHWPIWVRDCPPPPPRQSTLIYEWAKYGPYKEVTRCWNLSLTSLHGTQLVKNISVSKYARMLCSMSLSVNIQ